MMTDTCAYCHPEDKRKMIRALDENGRAVMVHEDEHEAYSKLVVRKQLEQSEKAMQAMVAQVDSLKKLLAEVEDSEPRPTPGARKHKDQFEEYLAALDDATANPVPIEQVPGLGRDA
jgi:septal ring factor EnvC (AmiA/AmiB activator)